MGTRAELRRERKRTARGLRARRALPAAALALAVLLALAAWQLVPDDSSSSGRASLAAGPPGAPGGAAGSVKSDRRPSAAPSRVSAAPKVPAAPARPRVARAATCGPFPSGVNAGTLEAANAWAAFRGRPVDVVVAYTGRSSWSDITQPWVGADAEHFAGFAGTWVLSVPMFPDSGPELGNLSSCAAGAYDSHWRDLGSWLVGQGRGDSFVRLGWEFNGDWFAWAATDPPTWISCFQHASAALHAADPAARVDWNYNAHNSVGTDAFDLYPGDGYVDVIGVDSYDEWPPSPDASSFSNQCHGTDGLCQAIAFARAHNKLFSVPEWGVVGRSDTAAGDNAGGDNPVYIQQMHQVFAQNADILAYESYFNDASAGNVHSSLLNPDENPASAAAYASLW